MNHLIQMEEQIIRLPKPLEVQGEISEKGKNDIHPSASIPGVLYGIVKIHNALEGGNTILSSFLQTI